MNRSRANQSNIKATKSVEVDQKIDKKYPKISESNLGSLKLSREDDETVSKEIILSS